MLDTRLPRPQGLYDPRFEHDACGAGFIADMRGRRSYELLQMGLEAVENLSHRGATGADAESGDGAGILSQIPHKLFAVVTAEAGHKLPEPGDLAVGMFFLPQSENASAQCVSTIETVLTRFALTCITWRQVPVDPTELGNKARTTMPDIRQVVIARPENMPRQLFERQLLLARKAIEREISQTGIQGFYACSFSNKTIVYKALCVAPQLSRFYPDLQNPEYETAICLFHQRYSTNTFPTWPLAQPFRFLGHNGEINTIEGNRNWMKAREPELRGGGWTEEQLSHLKPVIQEGGSDSCSLDNVLELLVASGRDVMHAMMMLIPEAYQNMPHMDASLSGFYEYHATLIEPWDGPAAVAFSDGEVVGACLDRNGLRPARYLVTEDGIVVMGSEAGIVDIPTHKIIEKGKLGPGKMLAVDTRGHRLLYNEEIKAKYAQRKPYQLWVAEHLMRANPQNLNLRRMGHVQLPEIGNEQEFIKSQKIFGYTLEDVERLIGPMAREGKESVGSMGDDTPLALFSEKPRLLYHYFKQRFAQVTNPPIDPLREKLIMSLRTTLGGRRSLLEETPEHAHIIKFPSPLLTDAELEWVRGLTDPFLQSTTLDATFAVETGEQGLAAAVERLCAEATRAIDEHRTILILSDKNVGPTRAPIPMVLAVGAVHHHLIRQGNRMRCALVCETGEAREEHHFATLIGFGASGINPYLAFQTAALLATAELLDGLDATDAIGNYKKAVEAGIYKIISKMGISTISSYRGAQVFEAVGLSQEVVDLYFTNTPSRLGGVGLREITRDILQFHAMAFAPEEQVNPADLKKYGLFGHLSDFGYYRFRKGGEYHQYQPEVFKAIHKVSRSGSAEDYRELARLVENRPPAALRDLLQFKKSPQPIPLAEVESVENIVKRFVASGMSHGALSREAHECIAIAMNRLGSRSNSGEGGEDPVRFHRQPNGDLANSAIKQIASARFGVTPAYLASASELEIKMAQGSKPGEGGQLPGAKVNEEIARIRHATVGVTLISPPPHHDIYSIEDLSQLIYDLKQANPRARVAVKLVSVGGVGTIAAGVAKAYADVVQISGHDGGTGASPLGSIKNVGAPWELGLAETQHTLVKNDLRSRIRVRVDGGFKSGRDVVVAALLGAEEYGFGTALLVAASCVMARQCHLNTCPVGVATQDPELRQRFKGKPEHVINYLLGVAADVRKILSELGYRSLDEIIGRVALLEPAPLPHIKTDKIFLNLILEDPDPTGTRPRYYREENKEEAIPSGIDDMILPQLGRAIAENQTVEMEYDIRNINRSVGAKIAGEIARLHGNKGFSGAIALRFHGAAGQSFGAFCIKGLQLILTGEANDYVGKTMNGGLIVVRPPESAKFTSHKNTILGNTVMYGATGGKLFAAGKAGERFCVRNSGGQAVVEGVGDHGCEYMTNGCVVILGETGRNFAAGMTGGVAYVLDENGDFEMRCNQQHVDLYRVIDAADTQKLRALIEEHLRWTASARSEYILANWETLLAHFWKVQPHPPIRTGSQTNITAVVRERHSIPEMESRKTVSERRHANGDLAPHTKKKKALC